jgi:metacaspase-1
MLTKPVTRAFIVGINEYENPANNLRGCVNDALTMAKIVTEHGGFPRDDVRLVCDRRATTANIRRRLQWLVQGAGPGSLLLFHYSGHGSQVRDRNGDELEDHLDEIICPHDLNWDDPMTDDEFSALIAQVGPEVRFTMILDCCHSGTGTREFFKERPRDSNPLRPRYLAPPPDIGWRAAGEVAIDLAVPERTVNMKEKRAPLHRFGLEVTGQNVVLIAGCRSDQTSADAFIDNDYRGALTYSLYTALEGADYRASNRDLVRKASEWLARNRYDQVPQLEGPADLLDSPFLGTAREAEVSVPGAGPRAATMGDAPTHVVFVHGIGDHKPR